MKSTENYKYMGKYKRLNFLQCQYLFKEKFYHYSVWFISIKIKCKLIMPNDSRESEIIALQHVTFVKCCEA